MPIQTEHIVAETERLAVLAHYHALLRELYVERYVAARDLARSEDGLVLERLPNGEHAWLRP